ncbi:serine/threonine kinase-like protein [Blastocystis sp. subtype 4]|uniref:serine/threonine kinase-like protein n=1 Tax=Blastocystis sp. subtype 4 TaxID=944170 RepID=UPI000711FE48|nr:serine/threonine kinase-like protein [Blastocystis sp. subtype 4]KNB45544.1 serine/threonine kinase-like protein [Blastocystis sp. subtype 4]|eukprot:XP_014528986.1 serine/threonine kinase-like protein [Blastocystis sp. subtype 4]
MSQLPETTRPLNLLTRTSTGLLDNTAGTMYFYPPESTTEQAYNTYAADIWSVGVSLYVMRAKILIILHSYPHLYDFLKRFLCRDPKQRISIDEILNHPWMKEEGSISPLPTPSPIDRTALTTAEISGALTMRCNGPSGSATPRSPDLSSEIVVENEEEEEGLNESQEKKLKVARLLEKQYNASKCSVV